MSKTLVFTICASNYYGLSQVLKDSIFSNNEDVDFRVFVADSDDANNLSIFGPDVVFAKEALANFIHEKKWYELAFKYNLTEFCTAIKPFCFLYAVDVLGYNKVIYLDPDIYVFSSLRVIIDALEFKSVALTPHLCISSLKEGPRSDAGILATGVFNLGFFAIKKNDISKSVLQWWGSRLLDQCYIDNNQSLFTDQRWMDFLPCLVPGNELFIFRGLGANFAPWNFHERRLIKTDNGLYVVNRRSFSSKDSDNINVEQDKLIFVHFSGYDYKAFLNGKVTQKNIPLLENYEDISPIFNKYKEALLTNKDIFFRYIDIKYKYNYFDNGIYISSVYRRMYRSLLDQHECLGNPFHVSGINSYFSLLNKNKLISVNERLQNNIDKINKVNISNVNFKLRIINTIMRLLFKIIGFNSYFNLVRFFRPYSKIENHIHLIDKKFNKLI